jgi:predicted transcriptional regulator of viral defense system
LLSSINKWTSGVHFCYILLTMKAKGARSEQFIESLQARGVYTFTKDLAAQQLGRQPATLIKLLQRLRRQGRLLQVRKGFYVIVPVEYRAAGCIPADWFIDPLMKFMKSPYYVGVLSAAAIHGAAHHAVQAYQVVVPAAQRSIRKGKLHIQFFRFGALQTAMTVPTKTWTGFVPVSTPEWTALDLLRFSRHVGGMDSVLTVLSELAEKMNGAKLVEAARREPELAHVQRLGWLLDHAELQELTAPLAAWVAERKPHRVLLDPNAPIHRGKRDAKWQVIINAVPESEV